ncbi:MAG: hypothetical protein ACLFUV_04315 [Methanomassiliicoccales archaeon]
MRVEESIEGKKAKRALDPRQIGEGELFRLIGAMRLSLSCFNIQPWRVIISQGESLPQVKEALAKGNAWATRPP